MTYYITIWQLEYKGGHNPRWEWNIYTDPKRRGIDKEASGITWTRLGARIEVRRWIKQQNRNRDLRYEITVDE